MLKWKQTPTRLWLGMNNKETDSEGNLNLKNGETRALKLCILAATKLESCI